MNCYSFNITCIKLSCSVFAGYFCPALLTVELGSALPAVSGHAPKQVSPLVPDHQEGGALVGDVGHQLGEAVSKHSVTEQEAPLWLVHAG